VEEVRAIVLAGGLGTRLRGVVQDAPKVMATVRGRPFLAHVLDHLRVQGIRRVVLAIGYRGDVIRRYFDTGARFGLSISYSDDGDLLRGTGGAIARALRSDDTERPTYLVVVNGDTYVSFDTGQLIHSFQTWSPKLLLAAVRVLDVARYGGLDLGADGQVLRFQEKGLHGPGVINAGVYFSTRRILLGLLPTVERFSFEQDVLQPLAGHGLYARITDGPFVDIGVPEDYRAASAILGAGANRGE
jgi:D-glycero-alpha-D-manno-heptose 1-phosphate guanylyltransferase